MGVLFFSITKIRYADCNFNTRRFINELNDPQNIISIDVNVPKSAKFAKNFLRIITSKNLSIDPKLRKRFRAVITVEYQFGSCKFDAKVRQNGDWKDHVNVTKNGLALQSLDVKLLEGNIMRAVRFKLLIPKTRNGINEILATLFLKKSGFISPETFEVNTTVNANSSIMLFQENARKELLEKNSRRESAFFEGDETIIWSYVLNKARDEIDLALPKTLSLSRMQNENWFLKGTSSQKIALSAYTQLQLRYLESAIRKIDDKFSIVLNPNSKRYEIFTRYYFALLAMNGAHALAPHNRKYYYNALTSQFEPIYYDGNIEFVELLNHTMNNDTEELVAKLFEKAIDERWIDKLKSIANSEEIRTEFLKRVRIPRDKAEDFLDRSIATYINNIQKLKSLIENTDHIPFKKRSISEQLKAFSSYEKKLNVKQKVITNVEFDNGNFIANYRSGDKKKISPQNLASVIAENQLNGERVVYLNPQEPEQVNDNFSRSIADFPGKILATDGVEIDSNTDAKEISFIQTFSDDWVLISSADLSDWSIKFIGSTTSSNSNNTNEQRFNQYGLTGCLTIYRSVLQSSNINVSGGACEDSLNIVESSGALDQVAINNAFADAIDFDFSSLKLSSVKISNAGNDCIDVSGGEYDFTNIYLANCGDKGISVGEQSTFSSKNVNLNRASIGVSSKDLSSVDLGKVNFDNVTTCFEAKQKKQEFGGAFLKIDDLKCKGLRKVDSNSNLFVGGL